MVPILEPEEPVTAACPLEDAQEKYKESVMQEIYTQTVLMLQFRKAVSFCMTTCGFRASVERVEAERGLLLSSECITDSIADTRVGTLIVATIYLQLIQNRYMFRSFAVLQCSHQHCLQPIASDVEVVGYL